ncbi:MAG TPA: M1 family aminopeptidase [Arenicellales bacterium]|nr:M1 family aminopeptidase [Arenicellales bacterium]
MVHDLLIEIMPDRGRIAIRDRITLPPGTERLLLTGAARALQWNADELRETTAPAGKRAFAPVSGGPRQVELAYSLPLSAAGRGGEVSAADSVYWDGAAPWYPEAPGRMLSFTLAATAPAGWRVVSQGARKVSESRGDVYRVRWREIRPQRQIFLLAAPFTEYAREGRQPVLMAFLRRPDEALAERYLDLAGRYIGMYESMLGEYPYAKFALVENDHQTGYAMPSFTLLGSRVIRLPFIPYTSFPHEILHNWWGGAVYVDYSGGNWSEGLTTYLSDHWLAEQRGEGAAYRRDALMEYRNFVRDGNDPPLAGFRARHGEASQALGYSKGLMLFHMLRTRLGDEAFFRALRRFYQSYRFREAGFAELRRSLEEATGRRLDSFFEQWVERSGAPAIALEDAVVERADTGFRLRGRLRQTQPGAAYELRVPVRVSTAGEPLVRWLELSSRRLEFEIDLGRRPTGLAVDPDFDLFRRPAAAELPPSFGEAYAERIMTFVLASSASAAEREAWRRFIAPWRSPGRDVRVIDDEEPLPRRGAVWLLGWDNARRPMLEQRLASRAAGFRGDSVTFAGNEHGRADHAVALAARSADGRPLLWTHLARAAPASTARRLSHYSRASHVAFRGGEPVSRGQWPVTGSPLRVRFE